MPKEQIAKKGHNRAGGVAVEQLTSIIERIEKLLDEKAGIAMDVKDVKLEAKSAGFDTKAIMECVKQRAIDAKDREEWELTLDTYRMALGLIPEIDDVV